MSRGSTPHYQFVHVGRLHVKAAERKPGVIDAYMKAGTIVDIGGEFFIQVTDADYQIIRRKYALEKPQKKISKSVLARQRRKKGLGDLIHQVAGPIGRAIHWPCLKKDGSTDLVPGSPCDKGRGLLNRIPLSF